MSRHSPELFTRDLKYLVNTESPLKKRRSGTHSHIFATVAIAIVVAVWLGGDPSASIDTDSPRSRGLTAAAPVKKAGEEADRAADPFDRGQTAFDASVLYDFENDAAALTPDNALLDWPADQPVLGGIEFGPHQPALETNDPAGVAPHNGAAQEETVALVAPPSLELATGFEEQQNDIELFAVETRFDLTALDRVAGSGWNVIDIKKGDTLSRILSGLGVASEIVHRLTRDENGRLLNSLQTGPNLKIRLGNNGELEAIRYNIDAVRILVVEMDEKGLDTRIEERTITVREREVSGTIRSSLFQAGADVGLSDQFVLRLAAIFKWNIDFSRDLHPGDRFSVIFEEKFIEDRKIATGGIVAAAFLVGGKKYTAIRHVETDGAITYYSADGTSLKRAFLRSPVKFSRISSKFSLKRFHPVLKKWRAHKGVDYAAGRGTPVLATADGVVASAGRNGGYGRAVILQHGKSYSTLYAHLDGFAKNVRKGVRVKQGQVIGYVGSSGLATGPHLHYEFRVNGEHKNPLTVDVPRALPIAGSERDEFMRMAANLDERLTSLVN